MRATERVTFITRNRKMRDILKIAGRLAGSDSPVLLIGLTGVVFI